MRSLISADMYKTTANLALNVACDPSYLSQTGLLHTQKSQDLATNN